MARAYFASKISENISVTPPVGRVGEPGEPGYEPGTPGYLICKDAVIARTGWQTYSIGDLGLSADQANDLDIDISDPNASIELYRSAEEVFDPATIASFEAMPVTDNHPPEFVHRENWREFANGHVQNVHKGSSQLESGEWPLRADVVITIDPLLSDVEAGRKRQLSCGYDYTIAREGKKLLQIGILGNHVAVVPKGRAGAEARINDSAPEIVLVPVVAASEVIDGVTNQKKENTKVKNNNIFRHLLGLGLKALAMDADTKPEQLADAAQAMANDCGDEVMPKAPAADEVEEKKVPEVVKPAKDQKTKDADERRARMHAALDKMIDAQEVEQGKGEDADVEELKTLLSGEMEPADLEDDQDLDGEDSGDDLKEFEAEGPDGKAKDKKKSRDESSEVIEPIDEGDGKKPAKDGLTMLRELRPIIARSNDAALKARFNAQLREFRGSRVSTGDGYRGFAGAAGTRVGVGDAPAAPDYSKLDAAYAAQRGKSTQGGK